MDSYRCRNPQGSDSFLNKKILCCLLPHVLTNLFIHFLIRPWFFFQHRRLNPGSQIGFLIQCEASRYAVYCGVRYFMKTEVWTLRIGKQEDRKYWDQDSIGSLSSPGPPIQVQIYNKQYVRKTPNKAFCYLGSLIPSLASVVSTHSSKCPRPLTIGFAVVLFWFVYVPGISLKTLHLPAGAELLSCTPGPKHWFS